LLGDEGLLGCGECSFGFGEALDGGSVAVEDRGVSFGVAVVVSGAAADAESQRVSQVLLALEGAVEQSERRVLVEVFDALGR